MFIFVKCLSLGTSTDTYDVQVPKSKTTMQCFPGVSLLYLEAEEVVAPTRIVFRHKDKRLKTIQENFCNSKHSLDKCRNAHVLSNW